MHGMKLKAFRCCRATSRKARSIWQAAPTGKPRICRKPPQPWKKFPATVANARQATEEVKNHSEQSAQLAVQGGGRAMEEVSTLVQDMHQSSQQMGRILSTIESIAFQTNILALNAAVEAARAGEQGRGFAVVAGEVRTLAQNSAKAAGEIRNLIAATSNQMDQSARHMQHAGETIKQAVSSVTQVSALIHSVVTATREQTVGVAQVNDALNDLDAVTQDNARLAEESARLGPGHEHQCRHLAPHLGSVSHVMQPLPSFEASHLRVAF